MGEVATAFLTIAPSAKGFHSKLDAQVGGDIDKSGKKAGLSFGKVFAGAAALGIGAKAFSFLGDSLGEAREASVIGARTANVIKEMGNAANISAKGVGNLAAQISRKTGIDDEAIQSGQNLLLTFGNVRNEAGKGNKIFNQTSQLMVDMSAAMGTDAKAAALQLGKALNDPTKGVTALARSGVSFTEQQKEQIKTLQESGNVLGAQKVILGEVSKQFGGAAESMATPADKAKVAIGNLQETIGTALLPSVNKATVSFTGFVNGMQTGEGAGGKFVSVLKAVKDNFGTIGPVLGVVVGGIAAYRVVSLAAGAAAAIQAAGTSAATGATWSLNAALRANPLGAVITLLTLAAGAIVIAYKRSDTFRGIVDKAFAAVKTAGASMGAAVGVAMDGMKKGFDAVGKAGNWLWNNALQPAFKFIVSGLASILSMWASMLSTLAKVPGFGWAEKAAAAMGRAADKANAVAAGIQKIPSSKTVNITVAYKYTGLKSPTRGRDDEFGINPRGRANNGPQRAFNQVLKDYGKTGRDLMDRITKGIETAKPKAVKAAQDAFDALRSRMESKRDDITTEVDRLKDVFAGIKDSVTEAFAGNLFDASATDEVREQGKLIKAAVTDELGNIISPEVRELGALVTPARTVGQNFIDGLVAKKSELTGLLGSFNTLKGWGVDPGFLTQLFASGNGALITELAGMGQQGALDTATLFGEVTNLGDQLGTSVATNDPVTAELAVANTTLTEIRDALSYLGGDIGKELNQAAAKAQRTKKGRGKK